MDHGDKPELRLAGDSFSESLVDEGHADALGVARTLAEKHHLPLVDLGVVGVDAGAVKLIALPVLNRVVAIPFASDGSTLKVAITDPQDVRGLDELQIATRLSVEFHVAARSDVLTELRRLSRRLGALASNRRRWRDSRHWSGACRHRSPGSRRRRCSTDRRRTAHTPG